MICEVWYFSGISNIQWEKNVKLHLCVYHFSHEYYNSPSWLALVWPYPTWGQDGCDATPLSAYWVFFLSFPKIVYLMNQAMDFLICLFEYFFWNWNFSTVCLSWPWKFTTIVTTHFCHLCDDLVSYSPMSIAHMCFGILFHNNGRKGPPSQHSSAQPQNCWCSSR